MSDAFPAAPPELADALSEYLGESGVLAVAHVNDAGAIVKANETLERLAGRSLAGRPIRELVAAEQHAALDRLLAPSEPRWQRATLGLVPDRRGLPRDFNVSCHPMPGGRLVIGEPLATTVSAVNECMLALNAELADAQRQIRRQNADLAERNSRLRELDHLKDTLLANVSHDLRTPLTAILGHVELMRRRALDDKQEQAVDVIERNARRLLRLVNDLLVLAQVRAGTLTLESQPVDLSRIAAEATALLTPLADCAGVRMAVRCPARETIVDGDPQRLSQLLDNLIANAVKFTPAGGTVTVRVRDHRGSVSLEVDDTGAGIPDVDRERLFEAFTRGAATDAPGTGLGLSIVKAIADAHGATIDIRSRPGHGTRFTVTFDRSAGPSSTA